MYIEARGHRLDYQWIGENSASAPLVFLHEGLGSIELWRDYPSVVTSGSGRRGLVYSRYGHGRSDPLEGPRDQRFMHDEALTVLPQLIDDLVGRAPVLIGHSDGASISLVYAGAGFPVAGLVLIAPHVMVEKAGLDQIAFLEKSFESTDLAGRLARYHDDAYTTFKTWAEVWLSEEFKSWDLVEYLPGITCPTLLIQSAADEYGTLDHLDIIERNVSAPTERLILPGKSHSPHLSSPGEVASRTVEFIKGLN